MSKIAWRLWMTPKSLLLKLELPFCCFIMHLIYIMHQNHNSKYRMFHLFWNWKVSYCDNFSFQSAAIENRMKMSISFNIVYSTCCLRDILWFISSSLNIAIWLPGHFGQRSKQMICKHNTHSLYWNGFYVPQISMNCLACPKAMRRTSQYGTWYIFMSMLSIFLHLCSLKGSSFLAVIRFI